MTLEITNPIAVRAGTTFIIARHSNLCASLLVEPEYRVSKKYTESQITGGHGVSLVAERVFSMGHAFHETGDLEAGIDGHIEIRDPETEEATGLSLAVQSKATTGKFTAETDKSFEYIVDERDLQYWLSGNLPVLLVVSRPDSDEAYYKSIKDYFDSTERRKERKVVFDKEADRFDKSAADELTQIAQPRDSGLYINPTPGKEELISNLLPVRSFADTVYHAETEYRNPATIWSEASQANLDISGDWILWNKRIWTVRDPRDGQLSHFCEEETTESEKLERWAQSDDSELKWNFVKLMKQCLRERLRKIRVGYNNEKGIYHFWPSKDFSTWKVNYKTHKGNKSYQTVFRKYPRDSEEVYYYRHMGFYGKFERIDYTWHLEITPTYYYTVDGSKPHPGGGKLVSNVKRREGHESIRYQVEFWSYQLRRSDFTTQYTPLTFDSLRSFEIDKSIDDDLWRSSGSTEEVEEREEPDESGHPDLFSDS